MATCTRTLRAQWLNRSALATKRVTRANSTFGALHHEMTTRRISPIFDDLSPTPSWRLSTTLADYLPSTPPPPVLPSSGNAPVLPIPHHLIYFEPTKPASLMLPDGTNPDQSPGAPYHRRMWAGGEVQYNHADPLRLDNARGVCAEFIRDVTSKGPEGEEKLFVRIERRLARASGEEVAALTSAQASGDALADLEHKVRQRLWRDNDSDFGPCSVLETRNIVFMRSRSPAQALAEAQKAAGKKITPQKKPDWEHTITPDPKLLFRFSALTFNAHAIHLDPEYCRDIEGHRERLFHGPLSFVFMIELLQQKLAQEGKGERVKRLEYKNLAPLYNHEPVKFCGTRTGESKWEIWTETPEGGVAVKGTVFTEGGN